MTHDRLLKQSSIMNASFIDYLTLLIVDISNVDNIALREVENLDEIQSIQNIHFRKLN